MKNVVKPVRIHAIIAGSIPCTLLICPSNPSSPKKSVLLRSMVSSRNSSYIKSSSATHMGTSNSVPVFLKSDGARLTTNLCGGMSMLQWRKVARKRSLDSFTALSGSQIISIVGTALFVAISTVTNLPSNHRGTMV